LNVRGINDGQLARGKALAGNEVEDIEGVVRSCWIGLVIRDQPPAVVGGDHLGLLEVLQRELPPTRTCTEVKSSLQIRTLTFFQG
jgi:hypothetical protein